MAESSSRSEQLDATEIHDVLRNERRRLVLKQLSDSDGALQVRDLAEYIAGIEAGETPPPRKLRQSVYVSLHQTHLPKLDELGIVSYDDDDNSVALAEHADDVVVYLEVVPRYGLSRIELFGGLSILGLTLMLASSVGVPLLSSVPATAWGAGSLVLVGLVSVYYALSQEPGPLERFERPE